MPRPSRRSVPHLLPLVAGVLLWLASRGVRAQAERQGPYLGFEPPRDAPELFAPNLVSTRREHSAALFSPGGDEIWFARLFPARILFIERTDGAWSAPRTAPFSGEYPDLYPTLTADGNRIHFTSQRPPSPGARPLPRGQGLLWYVERRGSGWSEPRRVDIPTEPRSLPSCASLASSGNLYLSMRNLEEPGFSTDIYRVRHEGGRYLRPERLRAISSTTADHCPFVAPDESYLIWASFRGGSGLSDLFISFRSTEGGWSEPRNLGPRVNSSAKDEYPHVTPDGRFLVFNSNRPSALNRSPIPDGPGNVYWVDARGLLSPGR